MKRLLLLLAGLFVAFETGAQGTTQFTTLIQGTVNFGTGTYQASGFGVLELNRGVLSYGLSFPGLRNSPAQAHFHADESNMIISLVDYVFVPPDASWPGGITYDGSLVVGGDQIRDLQAGRWYIQLHSPEYENGVLRGYVVPVSEPSASALLAFALSGVCLSKLARRRRR